MIDVEINWILFGLITGAFWGVIALLFYLPKKLNWKGIDIIRSIFAIFFQFAFNFIGGFFGWFCLALFIARYNLGKFSFPELILLGISILGILGKLSDVIFHLPGAIQNKVHDYFNPKE